MVRLCDLSAHLQVGVITPLAKARAENVPPACRQRSEIIPPQCLKSVRFRAGFIPARLKSLTESEIVPDSFRSI